LFGLRVAAAKASSLISFGTAFGILREQCSLVEPVRVRPHIHSTKLKRAPIRVPFLIWREGGIHIYAHNPFECAFLEHEALKVTTIVTTFFNSIYFKGFS